MPADGAKVLRFLSLDDRAALIEFLISQRGMKQRDAELGLMSAAFEEVDRLLIEMRLHQQNAVGPAFEYNPYG